MPSISPENQGKKYWRSLDDLADTAEFKEFVKREFPARDGEWLDGSRRDFLKIMGASFALAGLAGCRRWPVETLAPYAHRPANRNPGDPVHYATTWDFAGMGQGFLVTSYDGRPTKIEGNPTHPLNQGTTDAFGQATVLDVYDPDRSRAVLKVGPNLRNGAPSPSAQEVRNWEEFTQYLDSVTNAAKQSKGAGFYVLCEATSSPSMLDMRQRAQAMFPGLTWVEFEPVSDDSARAASIMAFGKAHRAVPSLDQARVIVSLDMDIFCGDPLSVKMSRDFANGRRLLQPANVNSVLETGEQHTAGNAAPGAHPASPPQAGWSPTMNRLYVVESMYTITGSMAENARHRIPVAYKDVAVVAVQLAAELKRQGLDLPAELDTAVANAPVPDKERGIRLNAMAQDLLANRGAGILLTGCRQPMEVHALAMALNEALGNVGKTMHYVADPAPARPLHLEAITALVADMNAGKVETLLILGGNPVFNAPADLKFAAALGHVKNSIHLSNYVDETSRFCAWHLPRAHQLEAWGDARTFDGTISIGQPLIEPIFGGRVGIEVLALVLGESLRSYEIVQRALNLKNTEFKWKNALLQGVLPGTALPMAAPRMGAHSAGGGGNWGATLAGAVAKADAIKLSPENLEVVFYSDAKLYDGRWANNGWLIELPDQMTKLTWDNAALIGVETAKQLKVDFNTSQLIDLRIDGEVFKIVALVVPGQPANSIAIALGYGRTSAGSVGNGRGFDSYSVRTTGAMHAVENVTAKMTDTHYYMATTQNHHVLDSTGQEAIETRLPDIIREATFAEFVKDPGLGHKKVVELSLWDQHHYNTGYQWGMSVDLTTCVGCAACEIACQAENNIPVVGKSQVKRGRIMHWIRIDRYYKGPFGDQPEAVHEPILCMQCENAPCEAVCPVGATSHSSEGLNMMTYNRCIGTRYCSNNCPYKVRRFNFFDYNSGNLKNHYEPNLLRSNMNPLVAMQKNPEVSVRVRGVMEKCTYCIQRIENARITAEMQGNRRITDGEVTPACAQACPTQALVFGDIRDKESRVYKLHHQARCWGLLNKDLHTQPRTRYLPKISNPHPGLVWQGNENVAWE